MISVKDYAAQYIARGWHVVPLEPQGKKCIHDDWLTRTYTPEDFHPTHNIGIKSVHGLVDIDNDCPEAVHFAEIFLPKTPAIYGRASRRRSHWLYRCPTIHAPFVCKDLISKTTLVELRVKHQSMAPPSVHPQGESIEWDAVAFISTQELIERLMEEALLLRSVKLQATGSMVARYYNPPGARHDWGIALAGFLRTMKLTEAEAEALIKGAASWAGDKDVKDRLDAVRSTYALSEDTPHTGATRLRELIGEYGELFVNSIRKFWGMDAVTQNNTLFAEMNARHAVVQLNGGRVCIMTEVIEDGEKQIRFSSAQEFGLLYRQKIQTGIKETGAPVMETISTWWLDHPKRRFYSGIELAPNGKCNPGYYNLWQGFKVKPKKGDWSLFKEHIKLLVEEDDNWLRYVITWMAETVQHPERPLGVALTFKGGQGTGKSSFATIFGHLFGAHFLHLDSEHRLLGQFNSHLHNAIVVLADEAVWAGGKQGKGALKRMITESTLDIERKGIDVIRTKNMLHMIVASNEDWVVPAGMDERRFAVFHVSKRHQQNRKFFGAVREQMFQQGGLEAMLYDLMEWDTSQVDLWQIPQTEELSEQKKHSMSPKHAWWYEQLLSGEAWESALPTEPDFEGEVFYEIDPEAFYSRYVAVIRLADQRATAGMQSAVARFLKSMLPTPFPISRQRDGKRLWVLPSLEKSRKFFESELRMQVRWPAEPSTNLSDIPF